MPHVLSAPKPTGSVSLKTKKGRLIKEEVIEYWLTADSVNPDTSTFTSISGYPIPNVTATAWGLCKSSTCTRVEGNRYLWSVSATFSDDIEEDSSGSGSDPTVWTPYREMFLEPYELFFRKDLDNQPFTNGAGIPYASAPPISKDMTRWDFFQFDPVTGPGSVTDTDLAARNNSINDRVYLGFPKHTILLKIRKSAVGTYYGVRRRLTEYSLTHKPETWIEETPNIGNSFVIGGVVYPYRYGVVDANGALDVAASEAIHVGPLGNRDVPLNTPFVKNVALIDTAHPIVQPADVGDDGPSFGAKLINGKVYVPKKTSASTPYYIKRRVHPELNFASMLRVV